MKKLRQVGFSECGISEITLAELIYGAEKSQNVVKNKRVVEEFAERITILPIFDAIELYVKEKARLKTKGTLISDFINIPNNGIHLGDVLIANKCTIFVC